MYREGLTLFIFLICFVFAFLTGRKCAKEVAVDTIDTTIVYQYDTTIYRYPLNITLPEKEVYIQPDSIDTSAVLRSYFKKREYETTHADTNISITFRPQIKRNELISANFDYRLLRPVKKKTLITQNIRQRSLYAGALVGANRDLFVLAPGLLYTQNKWAVGYNYDLVNNAHFMTLKTRLINFQ